MTLIVGYRSRNKYILAADSRVTTEDGTIESENCNKIEVYENYILAGAGTCTAPAVLKKHLFDLDMKENPAGPLDAELSCLKLDTSKDAVDGSILLLELSRGKIINILNITLQETITAQNLLVENQRLIALGSGASCFHGLWRNEALEKFTLPELKKHLLECMQTVSAINVFCNDRIQLHVFDIHKDYDYNKHRRLSR